MTSALRTSRISRLPAPWRRALPAFLLVLVALLAIYYDTAKVMVAIWARSDTFAHAFLVLPIVLWLVWRQRHALAVLEPKPCPWLLVPMAALAFAWLLGDLVSVNSVTQLAMTALLVLAVPAVLGLQVASAIAFPLAFTVLCGSPRRVPLAAADVVDRGLHGAGAAGDRNSRLSRGQPVHHSVGKLVGRRGLQRGALPYRLLHGRDTVRLPELPFSEAALDFCGGFPRRTARRQLGSCLPHRLARPPFRQQDWRSAPTTSSTDGCFSGWLSVWCMR